MPDRFKQMDIGLTEPPPDSLVEPINQIHDSLINHRQYNPRILQKLTYSTLFFLLSACHQYKQLHPAVLTTAAMPIGYGITL